MVMVAVCRVPTPLSPIKPSIELMTYTSNENSSVSSTMESSTGRKVKHDVSPTVEFGVKMSPTNSTMKSSV